MIFWAHRKEISDFLLFICYVKTKEEINFNEHLICGYWRRQWQPTPVFLPGESQGRRSLVGRRLWGRTESDTTEAT